MDFTVSGMYKNIRAYFAKMTKRKRFMLAGIAALVVIGAIILTKVLDNSSYTVLYRGLSSSEGVEIVNMLESAGVDYRLEDGGTILVPRTEEASLRMQLATSGFPDSTLGYDIFTSQADLMTTDYEKRQYLIFQLQDRLQEALKTLTGVRNAIVTLNVAAEDTYVLKSDKAESTAAVVLDLYPYAELGAGQMRGVEELVAKSVPGLKVENVIIVDGEGTILNDSSSDFSAGLADSQIELVDQINRLYEEKIERFLEPVFGSDGMSVSVSAQLNFQQKSSEQTVYSPVIDDSGIISKQQTDSQSSTDGTQAGAAGTEENVGTPTYQDNGTDAQSTNSSQSNSTEYLVNQLVESVLDNGGQIQDMTVSMLINSDSLEPEAIEQYRRWWHTAWAFSPRRCSSRTRRSCPSPRNRSSPTPRPILSRYRGKCSCTRAPALPRWCSSFWRFFCAGAKSTLPPRRSDRTKGSRPKRRRRRPSRMRLY
jgi:flagellar M-ring protein FliF